MVGSAIRVTLAVVAVVAATGWSVGAVFAQTRQTPSTARDVLALIAEEVALERQAAPTVRYWWIQPNAPQWTESDERIRRKLTRRGVDLVGLSGGTHISNIYRRPNLSLANAATLGSLVGAKQVLAGTISYQRKAEVGPLSLQRVSANAEISLLSAESGETTASKRFTVERDGFAPTVDAALERARRETTEALADVLASELMRGPGPVGVRADETFIGLHNAERADVLQKVRDFLEGLDQVDAVDVRWTTGGLIALEVNPAKHDGADVIEHAIRALKNQPFDQFSLAARPHAGAAGMAEFDVAQAESGQF